ncbi:hypothetical protein FHS18_002773 [Paenibacillus phyllosphaerae]|uniref:Uncharacterized protein n=1 Tax=Paenibacillus phyllosphaerae TaxID=274593 RepID=A0A7W5AYZ7_9BACL|nr:hypothetical protein [Paenibacillus phyllosphaerae]MBB3110706.1 hypothetical protein [Paenibacillus phyllosphaerae]
MSKQDQHKPEPFVQEQAQAKPVLFTKDGKPLRVLSTSLGIALVANALLGASFAGEASAETSGQTQTTAAETAVAEPTLVEWSNDNVKAFFDPTSDWNIPLLQECDPAVTDPQAENACEDTSAAAGSTAGSGTGGTTGGTTVIHTYSGFGWDDLLLYHMIFNNGSAYSTTRYHSMYRSYDIRTGAAYKVPTYKSDQFQNSPVTGSAVRPKTTNTTGTITKRSDSTTSSSTKSSSATSSSSSSSTSSSAGGIGGKSSSFSSSGSSSKSSGGLFGG